MILYNITYLDYICFKECHHKMGEAKRREELGLPPREKKIAKSESKSKLNQFLNKYPYFPYILGLSLLTILIIDLVNYYK